MQARQYSQQQQAMQSAQYYQHQPPPYGPPHGPGYAYTYGQYPPTAGMGGYGAFQGYGPAYGSTSSFSPAVLRAIRTVSRLAASSAQKMGPRDDMRIIHRSCFETSSPAPRR